VRYVALGDSYTIGTAVAEPDRWPNQLVARLGGNPPALDLVANLGVNGYTTDDLIRAELPALERLRPQFVSLLIGVNDVVQAVPHSAYSANITSILDGVLHPGWTWDFVRAEPIRFANVVGRSVGDGADAVSLSDYINTQFDPGLSWRDVEWFLSIWKGPLVLKGVQTVEDAKLAAQAGVAAVALSNHGGRQLDSAPAPLDLVPAVADAVGDRLEIICDGGVRRGSDVVKAVALGARACMAGRAFLYGLGAAGELGVDHVCRFLATGMRRTMALIGCRAVGDLSRDYVEGWSRADAVDEGDIQPDELPPEPLRA